MGAAAPLASLTRERARAVTALLTDIDDTLTTDGRLGAEAYEALWRLHEAGFVVIPVTGRPAGWCDLIARQWPVDAVVGENGAFAMRSVAGRVETIYHPNADRSAPERLATLRDDVLSRVPDVRVAGDQAFRWFDLAIDFAEEEPKLGLDVARRVQEICIEHGAQARVSSIHVNAWFGTYGKAEMARTVLTDWAGLSAEAIDTQAIFVGDSPNDEPIFASFPLSVGVANLAAFLDDLTTPPAFLTEQPSGAGFAEVAERLLAAR